MRSILKTSYALIFLFTSALANAAPSATVEIMFYNVFNLFDAQHDEGKDDWTFLPAHYPGKDAFCRTISNTNYRRECETSNWNDESVALKISQVAKAIKAATGNNLPDMIGLSEVENANVVGMLASELGYPNFQITESPDERGIDVALMYKENQTLKFVSKTEHNVSSAPGVGKATRNILEVKFTVGNQPLFVFVNHWPSQAAPAPVRVAVAKQLQAKMHQRVNESRNNHVIAMGDFNVVDGDYPHPINSVLLETSSELPLLDVHKLFQSSSASRDIKSKMAYGTYFYPPDMSWARLDRFFIDAGLNDGKGLDIDPSSYRILSADILQQTANFDDDRYYSVGSAMAGVPYRAKINATNANDAGFSDHFPVFVKLKVQ